MLLSHCLSERDIKNWTKQSRRVFVPLCVCQTNEIISCIRKYDKYNLRMLDQSEAKPWVSDAIVNEEKNIPSHSMFCTRADEAVIQRQEVVQPLPHYINTLSRQRSTKGWGKEVTAPQGFLINPPLLNILHNDIMHYIIISSDIIVKYWNAAQVARNT